MLNKLKDNIFYMEHNNETDRPILGVICGKKASLIVDAGASPKHAKEFLEEIKQMNIAPVKYLVITHYHVDHTFGINTMNLITIGHEETKEKLQKMKKLKWDDISIEQNVDQGLYAKGLIKFIKKEISEDERQNFVTGDIDIVYKDSMEVDLGGLTCILKSVEGSHTDDSTIVYIPEEKVMFVGDCIYGRMFNEKFGYDGESMFKMIDIIEGYETEYYVAAHENICDRKEMVKYWNQLRTAADLVGESVSNEEALKAFQVKFNKEPSEDDRFFIESFINRNKAR